MAENQEILRKGEVLFLQGEMPTFFCYLHSGNLEILSAPEEFNGLDRNIILSRSQRVGVVEGKSLVSGMSMLFLTPYSKSLRAIDDCILTKYPIKDGGFRTIAVENPGMAVTILSHLLRRFELSYNDALKYEKFYLNIKMINDNLALLHKELSVKAAQEDNEMRADEIYQSFKRKGNVLPQMFDARFIVTDHSSLFESRKSPFGVPMDTLVDKKDIVFFKRFIQLDAALFGQVVKADSAIAMHMYEQIAENLMNVLNRIETITTFTNEEIVSVFGTEKSWASFLTDTNGYIDWRASGRVSEDFLPKLVAGVAKVDELYEKLSGKKIITTCGGVQKLQQYMANLARQQAAQAAVRGNGSINQTGRAATPDMTATGANKNVPNIAAILPLYKDSIKQIFQYALVDNNFQSQFYALLNEFKALPQPFSPDMEVRKVRRHITKMYWQLYGQVFIRQKKDPRVPPPVNLMIRFGFMDENMVTPEQLASLHNLVNRNAQSTEIPVYFEQEFLDRIYDGNEMPSINEMGLSYEAYLREVEKSSGRKDEAAPVDPVIKKIVYEIEHRVTETVSICSGSRQTAFPILHSSMIQGNIDNNYINKEKVIALIKEIHDIDYSVFSRETILKIGEAREIIEEEVIPNFILIPCSGSHTMLWQDLEGNNKKSRGRIVIPIFFTGDLRKNLLHTLACFRWELNRTLKGPMWADPVEGGLTGIYFDYVTFYKKNSKLSPEAKAKIAEKFKSIRDNKNRFADDYLLWMLFEKDGIMKMNVITRDIFYKYIPFPKPLRQELEKMPAFSEIAVRFANIRNRALKSYQTKFKKYADANGVYPEEIQKFMDFLEK